MTILNNTAMAVKRFAPQNTNIFHKADPLGAYSRFNAHDHYAFLHSNQAGTVMLWEKNEEKSWYKIQPGKHESLIIRQIEENDRYMTVNEFDQWRQINLLKSLRALYVDLDNPSLNVPFILEFCSDNHIPFPNLILMSGRGAHLYWLLEPADRNKLGLWQVVINYLIGQFLEIGADTAAKDCTRVLRIADTINSKNGEKTAGFVISEEQHDLTELAADILPWIDRDKSVYELTHKHEMGEDLAPLRKKKAVVRDISVKQKKRAAKGSIYDWWHLVSQDLFKIAEHAFPGGSISEGHRDQWLFLMSVSLSWFTHPEAVANEIAFVAKKYLKEEDVAEALRGMSSAIERAQLSLDGKTVMWNGKERDPRYFYKRQTLYAAMQSLISHDLIPELRAIIPEDVWSERKLERDQSRWATHHKDQDVKKEAIAMRKEGVPVTKIAAHCNVKRVTIYRWLKQATATV